LSKAASLRWRGVVGVGVAFGDAGGGDGEGGAGGEVLPGGGEEFEFVEAAGEALGSGEADVAGAGNGPGLFGAEGGDGRAVAGAEGGFGRGALGLGGFGEAGEGFAGGFGLLLGGVRRAW
jgi:hypothetical protein